MTPCPYRPTATASTAASATTVPGSLPGPLPRFTAWAGHRQTQAGPQHSQLIAPARPIRIDTTNGITMLEVPDACASPVDIAINQACGLRPADLEQIITPCANACAAIVSGCGRRDHWATLCGAINMAHSIEKQGVVRGMAGHLASIEATLLAIATRAGEDNTPPTWQPPALSLDETDNLRLLVQLHQFQLAQLSYGEYRAAYRATVKRVQQGGGQVFDLPAEFGPEVTV